MNLNRSQKLFSSSVFFSFDLNQVFSARVYKRPCIQTSAWMEIFPPGVNKKAAAKMTGWEREEMFGLEFMKCAARLLLPPASSFVSLAEVSRLPQTAGGGQRVI